MIHNYIQQLKDLQSDRTLFESTTTRKSMARSLSKQEDKYQAYIIDQMASQNKIIAANSLTTTLNNVRRIMLNLVFKNINKTNRNNFTEQSTTSIRQTYSHRKV